MSLADIIRKERANEARPCKTCICLAKLTPEDRADFDAAVLENQPGSVLAKAITARLAELDIEGSVGASSVLSHMRRKHVVA